MSYLSWTFETSPNHSPDELFLKTEEFFKNYVGWNSYIQGVSYWSMQSKSALRDRRFHNFIKLWCLVGSRGLEIWVASISFQKSNIGWPHQPPTERVSVKLDFWWSISQKGTGISHSGARDDLIIRLNKICDEMRLLKSLRPLRLLRPLRPLRFLMPRKSLNI